MAEAALEFHSVTERPVVEIIRISNTGGALQEERIALLSSSKFLFGYEYTSSNLQSFSFSRSVDSLYGEFELQLKEDYSKDSCILDKVQPLDVVRIYEKKNAVSFFGVVQSVSFGATAGAYNKAVTISGSSLGILFEMFSFSTDATNMAFFSPEGANKAIAEELNTLLQQNVDMGGEGIGFKEGFKKVYNAFVRYATNSKYTTIAASGIYDIIKYMFGDADQFLNVDESLRFSYQVSRNLFDANEVTPYSYFRGLLPEQVYEIYEEVKKNKPVLTIREKPFDFDKWQALEITTLNPALMTDFTVSKSDKEVYSCFFSMLEGSPMSSDFYSTTSATEQGNKCFVRNEEKQKMYGYRPLIVNFVGYERKAVKSDKEKLADIFIKLSEKLNSWYGKLDEMYNGDVTVVATSDSNDMITGQRAVLCGGTFYVTGEKHLWSYGSARTVNYNLERGGCYLDKDNGFGGFSKLKYITRAFAELLEKNK